MTDPMPVPLSRPNPAADAPPLIETPPHELAASELDSEVLRDRCRALGIEWTDEAPETTKEAVALIDDDVAVRLRVVPLRIEDHRLHVAMVDPTDFAAADEVATLTGYPVTRIGLHPVAVIVS